MNRRTMILTSLAALGAASMASASDAVLNAGAGTPVFSSDGANVGAIRSRGRIANGRVRLFVRDSRGSLFRRIDEDVIIDVPADMVSLTSSGVVIAATAQTLRQRLRYHANVEGAGRIRL